MHTFCPPSSPLSGAFLWWLRGRRALFFYPMTTIPISNAAKHPIALGGRTFIELDDRFAEWLLFREPKLKVTALIGKNNRVNSLITKLYRRENLSDLARLCYGQPTQSSIHYADGDILNQRRENLVFPSDSIVRLDDEIHVFTECGALVKLSFHEQALELVTQQRLRLNDEGHVVDMKNVKLGMLVALWSGFNAPYTVRFMHRNKLDLREDKLIFFRSVTPLRDPNPRPPRPAPLPAPRSHSSTPTRR